MWPPESQLIVLTLRLRDKEGARRKAYALKDKLSQATPVGVVIYDPLSAHTARIKGKYVWEMLVRVDKRVPIKIRNRLLAYVPSVWEVDVDPISTIN